MTHAQGDPRRWVYVGTYTQGSSEGIYLFRFDGETGRLEPHGLAAATDNPSFLTIHPHRPLLYAANEQGEIDGRPGGAVSAFTIDPHSGRLTFLNRQPTQGTAPCHLRVDATGRTLLVSNYGSGSVTVFPIQEDGSLGEATDFVQHQGSSVNPKRQREPHAHSVTPDPTGQFALVADLGLDKVMVYALDPAQGTLKPHVHPWAVAPPGSGPRHLDFHPNGRYVYVINEIDSTLTTFAYDGPAGRLEERQTLSTLPDGAAGSSNSCADIHVHPSGRFVYGSNRGHDSIAVFTVDPEAGTLTPQGHVPTGGRNPRNFALDPTGAFLLAANQGTDTIVTFRIDPQTGALTPTGDVVQVPTPVCIQFLSPAP